MAETEPRVRRRYPPEVRRAEIIESATRLIATAGFNGVSLAQVAEASGMTNAGLLHHFASKTDLLIAVLDHRDELDVAFVTEAMGPMAGTPSVASTLAALRRLVERNLGQPEIVRLYTVLSAEALDPAHPAHGYFDRRLSWGRRIFAETLAWYPDPDALAVRVLAFMDGLQLNWLRDPSIDFEAHWDAFAASLVFPSAE
jgi:AcrR family transcriptional regulator